jgi:hypothetical protein
MVVMKKIFILYYNGCVLAEPWIGVKRASSMVYISILSAPIDAISFFFFEESFYSNYCFYSTLIKYLPLSFGNWYEIIFSPFFKQSIPKTRSKRIKLLLFFYVSALFFMVFPAWIVLLHSVL